MGSIKKLMSGHYQVRLQRDEKPFTHLSDINPQALNLMPENNRINHQAVADDVDLVIMKDPRGNKMQHVLHPMKLNRVTGIRTALETGNNIIIRGQDVNYLTLSLIPPLEPQQNVNIHCTKNSLIRQNRSEVTKKNGATGHSSASLFLYAEHIKGIMMHNERLFLAGAPDYVIDPRIAELDHLPRDGVNQMVMMTGFVCLFILGLVMAELMPCHQFAVEQKVNSVVERSPRNTVILVIHELEERF